MKAKCILTMVALAGMLLPAAVHAASDGKLLELINAYRADPPPCEGVTRQPLPPLAPSAALAKVDLQRNRQLLDAIRAAGYQASRAEALKISGPSDPGEAMRFAAQNKCRLLLSRDYAEAGIAQQGQQWQIILAQPLLDSRLEDWRKAGQQVLQLVNTARADERSCGNRRFKPAPALRWNARLGNAALKHSRDMASHNFFGHEGHDGNRVDTRATEAGYAWRTIGENVAAGQGSPQQVVDGWLASPGHCANIMNRSFAEMGAAYATNPDSKAVIYWTQVFGAPR